MFAHPCMVAERKIQTADCPFARHRWPEPRKAFEYPRYPQLARRSTRLAQTNWISGVLLFGESGRVVSARWPKPCRLYPSVRSCTDCANVHSGPRRLPGFRRARCRFGVWPPKDRGHPQRNSSHILKDSLKVTLSSTPSSRNHATAEKMLRICYLSTWL